LIECDLTQLKKDLGFKAECGAKRNLERQNSK